MNEDASFRTRRLFMVGTRGIPARYGGFERFAEELSIRLVEMNVEVLVTCERPRPLLSGGARTETDVFEGVRRLFVSVPEWGGPVGRFLGEVAALRRCEPLVHSGDTVYVLGYGVGRLGVPLIDRLRRRGARVWLNPDGLEWRRRRWPGIVRSYLRAAERALVPAVDRVICDSRAIESYIHITYPEVRSRTRVIEYGSTIARSRQPSPNLTRLLGQFGCEPGKYYLVVGRFVAENNLDVILREFGKASTTRKLLIVSNVDRRSPYFRHDIRPLLERHSARIGLVGPVYDSDLLRELRSHAFAYIHGHEVGGTNPSLLEAMGVGSAVLALDVPYNVEVLRGTGLLFRREAGSLGRAIGALEAMTARKRIRLGEAARERVAEHYNWERIVRLYRDQLFEAAP